MASDEDRDSVIKALREIKSKIMNATSKSEVEQLLATFSLTQSGVPAAQLPEDLSIEKIAEEALKRIEAQQKVEVEQTAPNTGQADIAREFIEKIAKITNAAVELLNKYLEEIVKINAELVKLQELEKQRELTEREREERARLEAEHEKLSEKARLEGERAHEEIDKNVEKAKEKLGAGSREFKAVQVAGRTAKDELNELENRRRNEVDRHPTLASAPAVSIQATKERIQVKDKVDVVVEVSDHREQTATHKEQTAAHKEQTAAHKEQAAITNLDSYLAELTKTATIETSSKTVSTHITAKKYETKMER